LPLAALVGLVIALFDYFWTGNGIHGTGGVIVVIVSTLVLLVLAAALAHWPTMSRGTRGVLLFLLLVDIAGTALAAYMLRAWWLLAAMAVALVGWLIDLALPRARAPAPAMAVAFVAVLAALATVQFERTSLAQERDAAPSVAVGTPNAATDEAGNVRYRGWYTFNGDLMDQKYAAAAQITPQNVGRLTKAW
jgi:quinoprotein glucose dehydrogenase